MVLCWWNAWVGIGTTDAQKGGFSTALRVSASDLHYSRMSCNFLASKNFKPFLSQIEKGTIFLIC